MKKTVLFLIALLPCLLFAQTSLKYIREKSYEVFAYGITAANVEKYIKLDSIPVDEFMHQTPAYTFSKDSVNTTVLPVGHYVLVSIELNEVVANMIGVSSLVVYPVNNQYNIQVDIRTQDGAFKTDAKVWVDDKEAKFNADAKTYWLKQRKLHKGLVKVYTPGDTTFVQLEEKDEHLLPVWKQRWNNFKVTKTGKVITFLPAGIGSFFKKSRRYKSNTIGASGYVLFNQPKYKLSDTVKLKAYLVNQKWKQFTKKINVFLEYYAKGKLNQQLLATLSPVSRGSYVYSFPLSDTLLSDLKYSIVFKTLAGKTIISKTFSTEDYLLDEIGSYQLRTGKENYYRGDTIAVYASAKDANGLSLLDGKATLILTTSSINDFYKDSLQVPDTLFVQEKALATEEETAFFIPANALPDAKLSINSIVVFRNSNNELHEKSKDFSYSPHATELIVTNEADSVFATYKVNGKPATAEGTVKISGDEIERSNRVTFPARLKADPFADEYRFVLVNGKDTLIGKTGIKSNYPLSLSRISRKDTLGFVLHNPYKIPVTFIVLDGSSVIASGKDDKEAIEWKILMKNKRKMYTVKWQYTWAGGQNEGRENIALLYKLLQVKVNNEGIVFPGQKDTVTIEVKDYKNRPAEGVNLAAVAYNSQFKKDIDVREPPYLVKYKNRQPILRARYETDDDPYILKRYKLGNHTGWIKRMGVDSMQFYKILFPKSFPYDEVTTISDFIPQVSIHVVQKGQPQEIYLLYLNRRLVYYNGVTDKMKYTFETLQGYSQVGIRLLDQYIEVDSLYIQPFYKHDIVFDLDSLPTHSVLKAVPNYWTQEERTLIENSTWQLDNNYKTNNGIVWQDNKVVKLSGSAKHLVGPFVRPDSLHFYVPGYFDIHFPFEPGYEYNLSKQIARLEKKFIFSTNSPKIMLKKYTSSAFTLGDTIVVPPAISYPGVSEPFIKASTFFDYNPYTYKTGNGKLQFITAKDTILQYVVLWNNDIASKPIVLNENTRALRNIRPGNYTLLLVNKEFKTAEIERIEIKPIQTLCLNAASLPFLSNNPLVTELIRSSMQSASSTTRTDHSQDEKPIETLPEYTVGGGIIKGKVIDAKGGNGIPGVTVMVKGTRNAVATKSDGSFSIYNIKEGKYTLVIASIGYASKEVHLEVGNEKLAFVNIQLSMSVQNLSEVVVVGYGVSKKRNFTGSFATIRGEELSSGLLPNYLQGRVAGVSIAGAPGAEEAIRIRGVESVTGGNQPIYVVDGIIYNELPPNVKPEMIQSIEVLKDAAATAIYGARGANGVIVITTGTKTQRNRFSDNAIWQPELFTGAEGKVSFEVTYPDNITGWELYVVAMDRKRRMGKGMSFTKAYKPLMAQLNTPLFLIVDDSVEVIGKVLNYTAENYSIQIKLSVEGKLENSKHTLLTAKQSDVTPIGITTNSADTLKVSFGLRTTTGFTDGEVRKIPVFKKGSEESTGAFYVVSNDTSFNFNPVSNGGPIEVYAQNNSLDVLLNELDHLKQYPYYCMEQTTSKLRGLLMEQQIREAIKQPFKNAKEINILLKKLQDNQLFDGGWSWWEKGKANLHITAYIVNALQSLRTNPLVETNIRNGLLYLQNELPEARRGELLEILATMSIANHAIDYKPYLAKLPFDSLTQHQQWQWVEICQQQKLAYSRQLQQLVDKRIETMTGGIHWGTENYRWFDNTTATTVLAFSVVEKEKQYAYLLPGIVQYFLAQRQKGFWRNTVESASITSSILHYVMETNKNFTSPASVILTGNTSLTIRSFPYSNTLSRSTKPITVKKTGGGVTYLTLYQKWWNEHPDSVNDKFNITTYFEKNGQEISDIPAGEKVKMMVKVNALKDAEYVMIEIPIPAGCNYASKKQDDAGLHKEFYKNKVVVFAERLPKGIYQFEIELAPRYKGSFTINPVKAELMYFPALYGRNEMRTVKIR